MINVRDLKNDEYIKGVALVDTYANAYQLSPQLFSW